MSRTTAMRFGVGVSVGYGLLIALLGFFDVGPLSTVAVVGALILAAMWVAIVLFTRPRPTQP